MIEKKFEILHRSAIGHEAPPLHHIGIAVLEGYAGYQPYSTGHRVERSVTMERLKGEPEGIARAVEILRAGGLVAFPTDTVYGLGADAKSEAAVTRLALAKGRPEAKPFSLLVASMHMARAIAIFDRRAEILASAFWPGALTLVLPMRHEAGIAPRATAQEFGKPIAAPSANPSGSPSPLCASDVANGLGGKITALLEAPPAPDGRDSTVIDLTSQRPRLLRAGAIGADAIEAALSGQPGGPALLR